MSGEPSDGCGFKVRKDDGARSDLEQEKDQTRQDACSQSAACAGSKRSLSENLDSLRKVAKTHDASKGSIYEDNNLVSTAAEVDGKNASNEASVEAFFLSGSSFLIPRCGGAAPTINDVKVALATSFPPYLPPEINLLSYPDAKEITSTNKDWETPSSEKVFAVFCDQGRESYSQFWLKALMSFVKARSAQGVEKVFNQNPAGPSWSSALRKVCKRGETDVVEAILQHGADANTVDADGETLLARASYKGHLGVVNALLRHGADANKTVSGGYSPLFLASENGALEIVEALLAHGAEADGARKHGPTPLWIASQCGNVGVVKVLLQRGADANRAHGVTPLWTASRNGCLDVVKTLLQYGADANRAPKRGVTPLWTSSQNGCLNVVKTLLQHGADANKAYSNGISPFLVASIHGHKEVAEALRCNI